MNMVSVSSSVSGPAGARAGLPARGARHLALGLVLALLSFSGLTSVWAQAPGVATVTAEQKAILDAMPEDAEPEKLNATRKDLEDRHYLTGDELHLDLFYPKLKDLGGGYAGVGSDQAYLFIGWQKPDFAWVTDYDPWISDLHESYRAFFDKAENIDEFLALWSPKNIKTTRELLETFHADHPRKANILHVFNKASYGIYSRLRKLGRAMKSRDVPSFVTDEAMYQDVRARVRAGRVKAMQCNLLADKCMVGLGEASRKLGVPLRALYVSNAEQYWRYKDQFRANIAAQNFDEKSLFVRTIAIKPANGDYHYNLQAGHNFQRWLAADWIRSYHQVAPHVRVADKDTIPFTIQDKEPESVKPAAKRDKKKKRGG